VRRALPDYSQISLRPTPTSASPEVVRGMLDRHGECFAVEVGIFDKAEEPWRKNSLQRLAWRRWPALGAPDLPAARAAHERIRAWAAEGGGQPQQGGGSK